MIFALRQVESDTLYLWRRQTSAYARWVEMRLRLCVERVYPAPARGRTGRRFSGTGTGSCRRGRFEGSRARRRCLPAGHQTTFRSRLTHTIEVVQIARDVAAALGLNEDLAETLASGA